jgi:hypothetical protein
MSKRPALASGPREENRKCKKLHPHKTSRKLAQAPEFVFAVYDGMHRCGCIVARGGNFEAFGIDGRLVGAFRSQADAIRALPEPPDRGAP